MRWKGPRHVFEDRFNDLLISLLFQQILKEDGLVFGQVLVALD
jgi:hypothetical protein